MIYGFKPYTKRVLNLLNNLDVSINRRQSVLNKECYKKIIILNNKDLAISRN